LDADSSPSVFEPLPHVAGRWVALRCSFAAVDSALGIKNGALTAQLQQLQTAIKHNPLNGTLTGNEAELLGLALAVEVMANL
jgi:hypothetical protein